MRYRSVLFVCLGNICRSPMAEAIFIAQARSAGVFDQLNVDSAGTGAWHVGQGADPRTVSACARNGTPIHHTARQIESADFDRYDLIIAMDHANARNLQALGCPSSKLRLMREFDPAHRPTQTPAADRSGELTVPDATPQAPIVPDPYNDGDAAFDQVYAMLAPACAGLLQVMRQGR